MKNPQVNSLSTAELLVVAELIKGVTAKGAAKILELSVHTINAHKRSIHRKMHIDNTAQLVARYHSDAQFRYLVEGTQAPQTPLKATITLEREALEQILANDDNPQITLSVTINLGK